MVNVDCAIIFGARADQQYANRQAGWPDRLHEMTVRQTTTHANRIFAVKEKTAPVVQQLPRQREQFGSGFSGDGLLFFACAIGQFAVNENREAPLSITPACCQAAKSFLSNLLTLKRPGINPVPTLAIASRCARRAL